MTDVISMEQARIDRMIEIPMDQLVAGYGLSPAEFIAALVAVGELPRGFRLDEAIAPGLAGWVIDASSMLDGLPFPDMHPAWGSDLLWSGTTHFDGSDLRRRLLIDQASRSYVATRVQHVDGVRLRDALVDQTDDERAEAIAKVLGLSPRRVADVLADLAGLS